MALLPFGAPASSEFARLVRELLFNNGNTNDFTISGSVTLGEPLLCRNLTITGGFTGFTGFGCIVCSGTFRLQAGTVFSVGGNGGNASSTSTPGAGGAGSAGTGFDAVIGQGGAVGRAGQLAGGQAAVVSVPTRPCLHNSSSFLTSSGTGGTGSAGAGGASTLTLPTTGVKFGASFIPISHSLPIVNMTAPYSFNSGVAGSSGSSGGGDGVNRGGSSGGGGGAGGFIYIIANSIVIDAGQLIDANGGNAGLGFAPTVGNCGGAGGSNGGSGGTIILASRSLSNSGTIRANGGTGSAGTAGFGTGTAGTNGQNGAAGRKLWFNYNSFKYSDIP